MYQTTAGIEQQIATLLADTTQLRVNGLIQETPYRFRVVAFNSGGDSAATLTTATLPDPPSAIRNFTAATVSSSAVQLTWADSTGETRYSVYRVNGTTGRQLVRTLSANSTSYRVIGLTARTTYRFILVASNAGGTVESEMITVTTPA